MHQGFQHLKDLIPSLDLESIEESIDTNPLSKEECKAQAKIFAEEKASLQDITDWILDSGFKENGITHKRILKEYDEQKRINQRKIAFLNSDIPLSF